MLQDTAVMSAQMSRTLFLKNVTTISLKDWHSPVDFSSLGEANFGLLTRHDCCHKHW